MKTKTFTLLCLLIGIAVTQLSAQNGKNGTGSVSMRFPGGNPFDIPVYCDGVSVDLITNFELDWHYITHYQNGTQSFCQVQLSGKAYGLLSEEVFEVKEIAKQDDILSNGTVHLNLKGNGGSHYIVTLGFDFSGAELIVTPIRAICN
jgi:hypothetical protein